MDKIVTGDAELVHGQLASGPIGDERTPYASTIRLPATWAAGSGPVYGRPANATASGLAMGTIGDRLPSERELAADAQVSRTTAVAAYEVLVDRGLLERRPGSGTFVRSRPRRTHVCKDPIECVIGFFAEAQ
jgi:hypothetical protein